jgi:hypothetical protein
MEEPMEETNRRLKDDIDDLKTRMRRVEKYIKKQKSGHKWV